MQAYGEEQRTNEEEEEEEQISEMHDAYWLSNTVTRVSLQDSSHWGVGLHHNHLPPYQPLTVLSRKYVSEWVSVCGFLWILKRKSISPFKQKKWMGWLGRNAEAR